MRPEIKRILIFCAFAFLPAIGVCLWLVLSGVMYVAPLAGKLAFAACMFFPAIASILTRRITREGFSGMLLRPNFKKNVGRYALAAFLPMGLIVLGAALYYLLYPAMFDSTMPTIASALQGTGAQPYAYVGSQAIVALLFGWLVNFIPAFGEELGWRGYLLPQLTKCMSTGKAILVSGAIWGVWHTPMIVLGHNYGTGYPGYPYLGILAMTVFCMLFGAFLSYLTLKVRSVLPAAMAHGALNAGAALGMVFVANSVFNPVMGPALTGVIPMVALLPFAVWFFLRARKLTLLPPVVDTPAAEPAEEAHA